MYLQNGYISGFQLLQFISPPQPTLKRVELQHLHGLSNRDLVSFLSQVSSTLQSFSINSCFVSRDTIDEEYAFDAVVHKMLCLDQAYIAGSDLATLLAITRKTRRAPIDPFVFPWPTQISVELESCQIDVDLVIEALHATGWHAVTLVHTAFAQWTPEQRERIHQLAREKGIHVEMME
jgi:hypothetical protein